MAGEPVLVTDSCSDLPAALADAVGVEVVPFLYVLGGREFTDDFGRSQSRAEFYDAMRAGNHPTTAVPRQALLDSFRGHAAAGEPLMYLSLSSGLSGTYDTACSVRDEVLAEFPGAEIRVLDTKAASVAQGLLVYEAARRLRDGQTLADIEAWTTAERPRLNGWFTIDDLETLRRGGRLPGVVASAGALLDVKPLLHLTAEGRLELKRSVRGRTKSMRTLADLIAERGEGLDAQTIAIAHADAPEEVAQLGAIIAERVTAAELLTMEVGPVIGSHTGPGMLAVVFWGAPV